MSVSSHNPAMSIPSPSPRILPTLARWLGRQLLIVLLITVLLSVFLVLTFDQRVALTLLYTFCITVCCSVCVQGIRIGLARLLNRFLVRADSGEPIYWPGWPLMSFSIVVGTVLGYTLGNGLANLITGFNSPGLLDSSLRRGLTTLLISLVPGVGLTLYFLNRSRLEAAETRVQTAQRQAAENQLRLLASQLEPHMLFNTLANLRVLIGLDPARAQAMLDQLIAFLRATLTASRGDAHSLQDEFARLADYLALMQVRMGTRLRPVFDLPPALAALSIPPLLLQPLVENAIKHGLEPAIDGGELRISARREAGQLVLEVADSGVGLAAGTANTAADGTHFGLHQIRERLATRYSAAARLDLRARPGGGCIATIHLPLP